MNIENIQNILLKCYTKDLCSPKVQDDWDENNKCYGMGAITSLIINDYFDGDICKIYVDGISHYFNILGICLVKTKIVKRIKPQQKNSAIMSVLKQINFFNNQLQQ